MYIKNIRIKNFRGIKDMNWTIKSRLLAIIGPSDSTKTTILDAIEMVLTPSWNIPINDYDFFNGQVNNDIVIELTIGEIPKELLTEEKYGLFVRKFVLENDIDDEPNEMDEVFLTLRLTINEFYEESWKVVNNRSDGKEINYRDRAKLNMGRVGENFYKDFSLTRNSVLNKYGDDFREIDRIILNISRNNKENFKLEDENLKSIVDNIKKAMGEYSIAPKNDFVTRLDIKNSDLNRSNISIYDGEVPIILNGTGTKRLMSSAMNINQMKNNSIVLMDELEYGLEPYRIRQLLVKLNELSKNGQVIFTSHSPIVMLEMQCTNISICRSYQGKTTCLNLEKDFQDIVRSSPEALLSKKVIVAEGRTECGILKALDTYIGKKENYIEYYGTSFIDGGGKNTTGKAEKLQKLGYDVLLFIDSDAEDTNKKAEELKEKGVKVVQWGEKNSTEQQIFMDMPLSSIGKILQVAIKNKGREAIIAKLKSDMNLDLDKINEKIEEIGEEHFRKEIGKSAKSNEWFKNEDIAEKLGEVIFEYYDGIDNDSDIKRVFREIKEWAYGIQFNDILYRDNILIKAAAGCGKTETIVKILDKSDKKGKFLILTHTNAGVESLIKRIKKKCIPTERYNVQTIASYCSKYVIAFPKLAKVTNLEKYNDIYNGMIRLVRNKIILQIITNTYCGLLVDEYQDCSETQHKIIKAISSVLPCKIFGDNMQGIFDFDKTSKLVDWTTVEEDFEYIGNLEYPWRWNNGNLKLGKEIIKIRKCLEEGKEIVFSNLSGGIQYIKDDDKHSDLIKKAYNLLKEKGTNVILFSLPNESHNFARIMNGNYASQEECERKELMKFCENFNYSALNILNMAKKCFTGFNKEYKSIYDNISQKKYTAKLRKNKDVYDICIALEKEFNYQDALNLLKVIENNSNIKLFRKELWSELKRVIKEMVISADKNIIEVAHTIRNISYKKYDYKNTISRVLLVKGLEFDNVIVVNPENMDKKLFYVAISRAKNKLIIVSKEEKIRFI